ncbi:hypothetical protein K437DRAFT_254912 [Tilletiaria anomala UBC 951]|uniref:UDP-N-acetylglucosamine--dolichyl-phosphate N-acetylglucosaminephosphotransferase n=1 Tax=Tilletiaria anomala (strain ATCC 24038 / CBS 436.72 / UBC 951) TaxID=1037660 RepID=A0A066WJY5_TILAU|nr:uncharacterized protein K437DRAFT_254912 [Tilletiaria anomala UBC 951]KDN51324.1 hypothetical protein K437DRAFT_254912 [Tilletiaria anomala UBC 951]
MMREQTVAALAAFSLSLAVPLIVIPPLSRSIVWAYVPQGLKDVSISYLLFDDRLPGLLPAVGMLAIAAWVTVAGIKLTMSTFKERGFVGKDLLKPQAIDAIPEMMGLPSACLYILLLFLFIPCRYFVQPYEDYSSKRLGGATSRAEALVRAMGLRLAHGKEDMQALMLDKAGFTEGIAAITRMDADGGWNGLMSGRGDFPHHELATFLSALLSLLSATMLGFLDDVFDIRWRYKIPIPIISSTPLLVVYFAGGGGTHVVVPAMLRPLLPDNLALIDLGVLYYVYISCLSTFCTNSINILAGINGVEVGQALIIALSLCANDLLYLDTRAGEGGSRSSIELVQRHLFSLYLLLPFIGTCLGLLYWNRHPSRVFVGDTFCYFAGQVLSVVGILGHFSKTLLLFFVPQVVNFLLSCPQLFGLVPCPRHRLPRIDSDTMCLYPSSAAWPQGQHAGVVATLILRVFEALSLVRLKRDGGGYGGDGNASGKIIGTTNLTILNALLVLRGVRGPMDESGQMSLGKQVRTSSSSKTPAQVSFTSVTLPTFEDASGDGKDGSKHEVQAMPADGQREARVSGPIVDEKGLWWHVMAVQTLGSVFAFAVRYHIAAIVFPQR